MRALGTTLAGSLVTGALASACCLGPVVLTLLGVSGGAMAHRFEPLRPYLLVATYGLLGAAFFFTYRRPETACGPGEACAIPAANRLGKLALWFGAVVVVLTTTFPWYSAYLF